MEMVRVFDLETRKITTIPVGELAPGMIQVRVQGIEGTVFVDASKLQHAPVRHGPFDEATRRCLRVLYDAVHEVYDVTPEQWEEGFRRDANPDSEIRIWFKIAACYQHFTQGRDLSQQEKQDVFAVVMAWINNGPAHVLQTVSLSTIPRDRVKQMVDEITAGAAQPELDVLLVAAGLGSTSEGDAAGP